MTDNISPLYTPNTGIQYNADLAERMGIPAAIVYEHLRFWQQTNTNNGTTHKKGFTWTYQSVRQIAEQIRGMSEKVVRTALKKLEKYAVIVTDFLGGCDRKKWYRLAAEMAVQKQPRVKQKKQAESSETPAVVHLPNTGNAFTETGKCLQIQTQIKNEVREEAPPLSRQDLLNTFLFSDLGLEFEPEEMIDHADDYLRFCQQRRGQATKTGFKNKLLAKRHQRRLSQERADAREALSTARTEKLAALATLEDMRAVELDAIATDKFCHAA